MAHSNLTINVPCCHCYYYDCYPFIQKGFLDVNLYVSRCSRLKIFKGKLSRPGTCLHGAYVVGNSENEVEYVCWADQLMTGLPQWVIVDYTFRGGDMSPTALVTTPVSPEEHSRHPVHVGCLNKCMSEFPRGVGLRWASQVLGLGCVCKCDTGPALCGLCLRGKVRLRVYVAGCGEEDEVVRACLCMWKTCVCVRQQERQSLWLYILEVNLDLCVWPCVGF